MTIESNDDTKITKGNKQTYCRDKLNTHVLTATALGRVRVMNLCLIKSRMMMSEQQKLHNPRKYGNEILDPAFGWNTMKVNVLS